MIRLVRRGLFAFLYLVAGLMVFVCGGAVGFPGLVAVYMVFAGFVNSVDLYDSY